ncbi:MAG: hypothetical protein IIC91_09440 [Chloroflexi bacterium]|nr:hypothetical protein [Chloroflexota bacterium]
MTPAKLSRLAVPLAALAFVAFACGGGDRSESGVILDVTGSSLTQVESFTLLADDGEVLTFEIAPDASKDVAEGFFPGHMRGHALAAENVTIYFREEDGVLLALRLEHD